nr:putative reverse transcriptase domain-containing protein [Tanacetum cinerariifolium]
MQWRTGFGHGRSEDFIIAPDGEVGNKGFPRLISHLKRLHLPSDECKGVLREAISTDHGLYMAVEETLKPSNKESGTEITEGLVFNAELVDRVFKVPITTVKCCTFPKMHAALQVYRPKNRQERMYGNRKSLQQSSILKSLAMWEKDDDITTLVKFILDGSALGSSGQGGGDLLEEGATGNTNIKQCLRKVANGHFTAVVKVLSFSGVASYCDDTIKALEANHPYKPPPSMPSITFSEPPLCSRD